MTPTESLHDVAAAAEERKRDLWHRIRDGDYSIEEYEEWQRLNDAVVDVRKAISDSEILAWLEANMTYFEHGKPSDAYWPQTAEDYNIDPESHYIGMSLRDYIETRIKEARK